MCSKLKWKSCLTEKIGLRRVPEKYILHIYIVYIFIQVDWRGYLKSILKAYPAPSSHPYIKVNWRGLSESIRVNVVVASRAVRQIYIVLRNWTHLVWWLSLDFWQYYQLTLSDFNWYNISSENIVYLYLVLRIRN